MRRKVLTLRPRGAGATAVAISPNHSSARSSTHVVTEDQDLQPEKREAFRLLDLPSELRLKIYALVFKSVPDVIDLDPDNYRSIHRSLSILHTSRQIHGEASHFLYSTKTFRIFPCHGRFFSTKKPLLSRLSPRCRNSLSSLELRLGPGFASPPKTWAVTETLGLKDTTNVRVLKVMVQVDTSNPIFIGYRAKGADDGFYELFSRNLLDRILCAVPSITEVQFDAWSSIQKNGAMMTALLGVVNKHRKVISWGPERGWANEKGKDIADLGIAKTSAMRSLPEVVVVS